MQYKTDLQLILDYELRGSWWAKYAQWVSWDWLQSLVSKYYAWKIRRKYRRYKTMLREREEVINDLKNAFDTIREL